MDVNADEVCSALMKEVNPYKTKDTLSQNTLLFVQEFQMAFEWARAWWRVPEAWQVSTSANLIDTYISPAPTISISSYENQA